MFRAWVREPAERKAFISKKDESVVRRDLPEELLLSSRWKNPALHTRGSHTL